MVTLCFDSADLPPRANDAVNLALSQACLLGHTYIGSEHLLLGLLLEGSGAAYHCLTQKWRGARSGA